MTTESCLVKDLDIYSFDDGELEHPRRGAKP
jgi:hypothetical protein